MLWFRDATCEHFEAQLIRVGDHVLLGIGFHAEYPEATKNDEVLTRRSQSPTQRCPLVPAEAGVTEEGRLAVLGPKNPRPAPTRTAETADPTGRDHSFRVGSPSDATSHPALHNLHPGGHGVGG